MQTAASPPPCLASTDKLGAIGSDAHSPDEYLDIASIEKSSSGFDVVSFFHGPG
ncbi:hypothetical protein [Undibacterium sp. TS12]|uniref:hypothetical protein n=1 Tax=Undibacterium sp. TS12 TaxID=2908202 RepID=UPI001F4CABA3|nr:hypothetical protein [Undibacterium sp. TS12]MCH8620481.1 hypothetical protein [Undibacterium sp. TS12]